MFIIISGGPDEHVFGKYFNNYEDAEKLLLDNGYSKKIQHFFESIDYNKNDWEFGFEIEGEEVGFQAYIEELRPYKK